MAYHSASRVPVEVAAPATLVDVTDERAERERQFHNELYERESQAREAAVARFYCVAKKSHEFYWRAIESRAPGARVLEYGCGDGRVAGAYQLAKRGASVIGIDISDVAVRLANQRAAEQQLQGRAVFEQMNGEALRFADDSFDLIHGAGILHHIDVAKALREISRTLKPSGHAIFIEPLGYNWFINLYRRATPTLRTADEHPLTKADVKTAQRYFERVDLRFFQLSSLASVIFARTARPTRMLKVLERVDEFLFRLIPPVRWLAWQVVMVLSNPKKSPRAIRN